MADRKLSQIRDSANTLTQADIAPDDLLYVVDVSAGTAGSKSITYSELIASITATPTATNQDTESFTNVTSGTTTLTLSRIPTAILEVERNGVEMDEAEYNLVGTVLTLATPAGATLGASNLEDFKATYQY